MAHRAEEISTYDFKSSEALLLDANIWLFVYGPQKPKDLKVDVYSDAVAKILAAKSCIYIDVLIVSEFVNTYARLKWNLLKSTNPRRFKQFRRSEDFKPIAQDIAADVKRILQHCTRVESGFESLAIDTLVDEYAAGDSDFNDQVLTTLCKKKGLKMVTDDIDFKGRGISVITANRQLLR
jgi:predicted nucleic acid-binding protein